MKQVYGGPFNGQEFRQSIFREVIAKTGCGAIVETGTHKGTTAEYMHDVSRLPVYTVELSPRHFAYARTRFRRNRAINCHIGDSRAFLRSLTKEQGLPADKSVFFYLDAHGEKDLPLGEELNTIFQSWPKAIVMIDDFKVEGDSGYGFDSYGPGKALEMAYLDEVSGLDLARYYPAASSDRETGAKRGCVVLAQDAGTVELLARVETLSRFERLPQESTGSVS